MGVLVRKLESIVGGLVCGRKLGSLGLYTPLYARPPVFGQERLERPPKSGVKLISI